MKVKLYQTLADWKNPLVVNSDGPFYCNNKTAWLGFGYYFWDTHIKHGHWWGKISHKGNYIICEAQGVISEECWDLHGNGECREEFEAICIEMIKQGLTNRDKLLVPHVISFLKRKNIFRYNAIRALGMDNSRIKYGQTYFEDKLLFNKEKSIFLHLQPLVQVCLLDKTALSLNNYNIVYPSHYIDNQFI